VLGSHDALLKLRNFYGTLRVTESGKNQQERMRQLYDGTIAHGQEYVAASLRHRATSYYGPTSGIGLTMLNFRTGTARRIGVIGLGAGTLATYGRPGDTVRFYELNPQVVMVAEREFWFLRDSAARTEIVTGDARLSMAREVPQDYDILVLDAFSSDSIPVHLLTREAFALYWRHLRPDGVLAVHVSNGYLDLQPVIVAAASALGKHAVPIDEKGDSERGTFRSDWVLVTANEEFLALPAIRTAANAAVSVDGLRVWTDDYSNLLAVLR
jgi:spermidine synthase